MSQMEIRLTYVIGDFIHVLEVFHPKADDIHKVLDEPEQLFDVGPQLRKQRPAQMGKKTKKNSVMDLRSLTVNLIGWKFSQNLLTHSNIDMYSLCNSFVYSLIKC